MTGIVIEQIKQLILMYKFKKMFDTQVEIIASLIESTPEKLLEVLNSEVVAWGDNINELDELAHHIQFWAGRN